MVRNKEPARRNERSPPLPTTRENRKDPVQPERKQTIKYKTTQRNRWGIKEREGQSLEKCSTSEHLPEH